MTWEDYLEIRNLLTQWELEDEFNYESDKLDKNVFND